MTDTEDAKRKAVRVKRSFLRDHALAFAFFGLFLVSLVGQVVAGHAVYRDEALQHGDAPLGVLAYLTSGHFVEAVFENWESEFLQMALFVVLTKWLRQKGSSESKPFDDEGPADEDPHGHEGDPGVPWPVRKGGIVLALYQRSLSISLVILFIASFALHAVGGAREHARQERRHGKEASEDAVAFVGTPEFWFQSFQNWQSEFVSVGMLVVLSIVLRERGSTQSKRVAAPHAETGE